MKEVTRDKAPKNSVARIKSLFLPTSVQPVDGDSPVPPAEPRKLSSWRWFSSGSQSEKDIQPTVPPGKGSNGHSPAIIRGKEKDVEKCDDYDEDENLAMEELRGPLEPTSQSSHHSPLRQSPPYHGDVEIVELGNDDLV